jgi:AcrR family transcriptional regulator
LGVLAESLELSKSGLFAHFRSKEALILALFDFAKERFVEHSAPYLKGQGEGLAELRASFTAWLDWISLPTLPAGCPIMGASFELEDVPGPLRDKVVELTHASRQRMVQMIKRAVELKQLSSKTDISQALFDIRGITLAFHLEHRLMNEPKARAHAEKAFEQLLARYRV